MVRIFCRSSRLGPALARSWVISRGSTAVTRPSGGICGFVGEPEVRSRLLSPSNPMKPMVDRESSRIRSLYFLMTWKVTKIVAVGIDDGRLDIAHRHPGQVDFGAGLEPADIFKDGPVLDVFLKESFLLGDDQDHDQQGQPARPPQRCRRSFHIFGNLSCGRFLLGPPGGESAGPPDGRTGEIPHRSPERPIGPHGTEDQPVGHQFRQVQVMGHHDGSDLEGPLEAAASAGRSRRR